MGGDSWSGRFFISYDHEIERPGHKASVRELCRLLRDEGLDVHIDADVEGERIDWARWMTKQIRTADRVLMIVSPRYRLRFEEDAPIGDGRGVEVEAMLIRDRIVGDPAGSLWKFVPVLLPGAGIGDIPDLLLPGAATSYPVQAVTAVGVRDLVRLLRRRPGDFGLDVPVAPRTEEQNTGALWLAVTSGPSAAVTEVMTAFGVDGNGDPQHTGAPREMVAHLLRLTRTLPAMLSRHRRAGGMPEVTVGAHIDREPATAAAGARRRAAGGAARRLHAAPRVGMVVAVSPAFFAAMADQPEAIRAAYSEFLRDGDGGEPVHLSAPGLSRCPVLPADSARVGAPHHAQAASTIIGDRGRININSVDNSVDNSDNFHIVAGGAVNVHGERA